MAADVASQQSRNNGRMLVIKLGALSEGGNH